MTIAEQIGQKFIQDIKEHIKETNFPAERLEIGSDYNSGEARVFVKDKKTGNIVGEICTKIIMGKNEPEKMTRQDIINSLCQWCDKNYNPCKACKCYKKCVMEMPFPWFSDEGLQEYYEFVFGIKVEVKE